MKHEERPTTAQWFRISLGILGLAVFSQTFAWTNVEDGLTAAKEGKVIDAKTGKPVAGAWVVAQWLHGGYTYVEGSSQGGCRHSIVVRTDQDGIYRIPDVSKQVEVQRSWSLFSQDAYKWGVVVYAPKYVRRSDFNKHSLEDVIAASDPEKMIYLQSASLFVANATDHPPITSTDASGKISLADVALDSSGALPKALQVIYLSNIAERSSCQSRKDEALVHALYAEAYRVACRDNASFAGAGLGLDRLWDSAVPPAHRTAALEDAIRKVNDKALYNNHEYTLEDRKLICELTQPDTEGVR